MSGTPYTHEDFTVVPDYCPLKYTYSETSLTDSDGNSDTAISRTDKTFTFSYDKDDAPVNPVAQTQTVTITAMSDSKYPTSFPKKSDSATFDLDFTDPCLSAVTSSVTVTPQNNQFNDKYSGADITFTYSPFTVSPSFCKTTVTCASVSPASPLTCIEINDDGQVVWNFGPSDYETVDPGTYVFTYDVGIEGLPATNE
jgi:hypothetical protein